MVAPFRHFLPVGFFLAFSSGTAKADQLTLYFYPSQGISWKTPGALARTTLASELEDLGTMRHAIGHARVEVECNTGGFPKDHFYTGMTSQGSEEERKLV